MILITLSVGSNSDCLIGQLLDEGFAISLKRSRSTARSICSCVGVVGAGSDRSGSFVVPRSNPAIICCNGSTDVMGERWRGDGGDGGDGGDDLPGVFWVDEILCSTNSAYNRFSCRSKNRRVSDMLSRYARNNMSSMAGN